MEDSETLDGFQGLFREVTTTDALDLTSSSSLALEGSAPDHLHHASSLPPSAAVANREFLRLEAELQRLSSSEQQQQQQQQQGSAQAAAQQPPPAASLPSTAGMSPAERALAEVVSSKVAALQEAMARYESQSALVAEEKAALARGRGVMEEAMRSLVRERAELHKASSAERAKLEAWRGEEASRLEKERRVAVRQARAAAAVEKALPDRKERAELEALRASVAAHKADLAASESRYRASVERHRGIVGRLEERCAALEAQIRVYEAERIEAVFGVQGGSSSSSSSSSAAATQQPTVAAAAAAAGRGGSGIPVTVTAPSQAAVARQPPRAPTTTSGYLGNFAAAASKAGGAAAARRPSASTASGARPGAAPYEPEAEVAAAAAAAAGAAPASFLDIEEPAPSASAASAAASPPAASLSGGYNPSRYASEAATGSWAEEQALQLAQQQAQPHLATPASSAEAAAPASGSVHAPSTTSRLVATRAPPITAVRTALESTSGALSVQAAAAVAAEAAASSPGPPPADAAPTYSSYGSVHAGRHAAGYLVLPPSLGSLPPLPTQAATVAAAAVLSAASASASAPSSAAAAASSSPVASASVHATPAAAAAPPAPLSHQLASHLASRVSPGELRAGVASARPPVSLVSQAVLEGGKVETRFADGTRLVRFKNGTERETSGEGVVSVRFPNGDVRRSLPSGIELYFYEAAQTLQTTYPSGGRGGAGYDVYEFLGTGQVELHGPAGTEIESAHV